MLGVSVDRETHADAGQAISQGTLQYLRNAADIGFTESIANAPEDRGHLKMRALEPTRRGDRVVWGYGDVPYVGPQEFGTEPYWPPARPLVEWAEREGMGASFGYYVQWKIAQEGIEEKRFIRDGADEQERWLDRHSVGDYIERHL